MSVFFFRLIVADAVAGPSSPTTHLPSTSRQHLATPLFQKCKCDDVTTPVELQRFGCWSTNPSTSDSWWPCPLHPQSYSVDACPRPLCVPLARKSCQVIVPLYAFCCFRDCAFCILPVTLFGSSKICPEGSLESLDLSRRSCLGIRSTPECKPLMVNGRPDPSVLGVAP